MMGRIGRFVISKLDYFSGVISLTIYSILELFKRHSKNQRLLLYQNTVKQIYFTAIQGLKSVFFVSLILSLATISILFTQFPNIVPKEIIADVFIIVIYREIMPLFILVIVTARSVSAIAVEIGNMTVNKEFDILVSMGIDPLFYLTLPRIIGMTISLLVLVIFASFIILVLGPSILILFYEVDFTEITKLIFSKVTVYDQILVVMKVLTAGLFMPSISSYYGFKTPTKNLVPVSSTKSIMASLSLSLISSLGLSLLFYIFLIS
ncbi:MAG: ABC transporter permease [Brevinematales bacterium]|nr:ABC transporter permease [Brevinematales bacterium]